MQQARKSPRPPGGDHPWAVRHLRRVFRYLRHRTASAASFAARINRVVAYGFDMVLWSNLFSQRRSPVPLEISPALLASKAVAHPPPALFVSGLPDATARWSEGFAAVNAALFLNLQNPDELSRFRYAHPAPSFRGIYLWDSAFIAQVWKWWDRELAAEILHAVIDLRDGARMQHFVADFAESAFTQPPLLAWSLAEIAALSPGDVLHPLLEEMYPPLRDYYHWLVAHRRLPDGLYAWAHPYESGVENAPRFSSRDERRLDDTRHLAAPDFSAYVALKCEALADLARRLGRDTEAAAYEADYRVLREAINTQLWDEGQGLYFDRDVNTGRHLRCHTIASLLPLWAGIPDPARAERLRRHVLDPAAFNTPFPLPTVARGSRDFEKDMWRGPVWLNTAYAVVLGLRRYGFLQEAAELSFRLCDGVYRTFESTRRLFEFYDPDGFAIDALHRKRGNRWKAITLGDRPVAEFIGWTGLVNTLIIDLHIGLSREADALVVRPCFPPAAVGQRFALRLPAEQLTLEIEVMPDQSAEIACRRAGGVSRGGARFGQPFRIPA